MKTLKFDIRPNIWVTLVILAIVLTAVLTSCTGPRVTTDRGFIQAVNEPITIPFDLAAYDTVTVMKSDLIAGVFAVQGADTIFVKGGTRTFGGHASGYVAIPATGMGIGYNDQQRIDSLFIRIKTGVLILTPVK